MQIREIKHKRLHPKLHLKVSQWVHYEITDLCVRRVGRCVSEQWCSTCSITRLTWWLSVSASLNEPTVKSVAAPGSPIYHSVITTHTHRTLSHTGRHRHSRCQIQAENVSTLTSALAWVFYCVSVALLTGATFCAMIFCVICVLVRLSASDWLERLVSEMTCNVLMGTLNPARSLTPHCH